MDKNERMSYKKIIERRHKNYLRQFPPIAFPIPFLARYRHPQKRQFNYPSLRLLILVK